MQVKPSRVRSVRTYDISGDIARLQPARFFPLKTGLFSLPIYTSSGG